MYDKNIISARKTPLLILLRVGIFFVLERLDEIVKKLPKGGWLLFMYPKVRNLTIGSFH